MGKEDGHRRGTPMAKGSGRRGGEEADAIRSDGATGHERGARCTPVDAHAPMGVAGVEAGHEVGIGGVEPADVGPLGDGVAMDDQDRPPGSVDWISSPPSRTLEK